MKKNTFKVMFVIRRNQVNRDGKCSIVIRITVNSAGDTGPDFIRNIGLGRIPEHARAMDMPVHTDLSVAAGRGSVFNDTGEDTGSYAPERHF